MPTFFGIYFGEELNFGLRKFSKVGRGGGLVVRILAFYSNDPSSNPAGKLNFLYEKTKKTKKRPGLGHLIKKVSLVYC